VPPSTAEYVADVRPPFLIVNVPCDAAASRNSRSWLQLLIVPHVGVEPLLLFLDPTTPSVALSAVKYKKKLL
jgi:hypothetical protein